MLILLLAVFVNILIAVCFKMFWRKGVDSFVAIVVNYLVCMVLGSALAGEVPLLSHGFGTAWVPFALLLGVLFVSGFNITALSIKFTGITTTAVMSRMSLLLSAGYAIVVFAEPLGPVKLIGIALAVVAILLINRRTDGKGRFASGPYLLYPVLALLFAGAIESVLYYIKAMQLSIDTDLQLTTYAFSVAGVIGSVIVGVTCATGKRRIRRRDLIGGLALGLPNFFSIYLILMLLKMGWQGSVLFPVLNLAILAVSAVVGIYLFSEKVSRLNVIGLLAALAAIGAIMLA